MDRNVTYGYEMAGKCNFAPGDLDVRFPYGTHIPMTCKNHPNLRWSTKNIGGRSIFFSGSVDSGKTAPNPIWPEKGDLDGLLGAAAFVQNLLDKGYVFECSCSGRDLRKLEADELKPLVRAEMEDAFLPIFVAMSRAAW